MGELVKTLVNPSDIGKAETLTSATASDYIVCDNADQRMLLALVNADTFPAVFTLKAGNGHRAAAGDVAITIPASSTYILPMTSVDSARVKNISGDNKGKILTTAATSGGTLNLKVGVISIV